MMRKYNIIEAVKEPVGTEFKYIDNMGKEQSATVRDIRGANMLNVCDLDGFALSLNSITADFEFEKVQKAMTFNEVLEKVKEKSSERIRVEVPNALEWQKRYERRSWILCNLLKILAEDCHSDALAKFLLESKWYIEEE